MKEEAALKVIEEKYASASLSAILAQVGELKAVMWDVLDFFKDLQALKTCDPELKKKNNDVVMQRCLPVLEEEEKAIKMKRPHSSSNNMMATTLAKVMQETKRTYLMIYPSYLMN